MQYPSKSMARVAKWLYQDRARFDQLRAKKRLSPERKLELMRLLMAVQQRVATLEHELKIPFFKDLTEVQLKLVRQAAKIQPPPKSLKRASGKGKVHRTQPSAPSREE